MKLSRGGDARLRLVGRCLALALLLHAVPALPAWFAPDSNASGVRLVRLCTAQGLRMVEVPADAAKAPARSGEDDGSGCVLCVLGKCTGCGSVPGPMASARVEPIACDRHARAAFDDITARTADARLRPPSRGPPVLV